MSESMENVKFVISDLRTWADGNREPPRAAVGDRMDVMVAKLEAVKADLTRLLGLTKALPPDLGNIHDLPQELLAELSVAKTDEIEDQIVTVIHAYGGEASLDQILVGLYRKFKVTQKRRFLQNKLYRMDMVWSVDGKKGIYTTAKPDDPVSVAKEVPKEPEEPQNRMADLDDEIPF